MSALSVRGLTVNIKGTTLLDGIDLDVARGEWLSVIGPNGAGKSTLLRALAGVQAASGTVHFDDTPLDSLSVREIARQVAWVPQSPIIPPGMKVLDYVLLGRTPHLHPLASEGPVDIDIAGNILEDLDLLPFATRTVDSLSGGERQRTLIARALTQHASVLLLDEPTTALDLGHQQDALDLLQSLRSTSDLTIVSTMHDLTLAGFYADRLVMLAGGRVVADGAARDVLTESNLSTHYRADVDVTHVDGAVLVSPRLRAPNSTTKE